MLAERQLLHGWGRTAATASDVVAVHDTRQLPALMTSPHPRGVIARGLGRSYGDAAQNAGGTVLDLSRGRDEIALDVASGTVTASAGTSLDALMRDLLPRGWFVPVTPGTRAVTVGGAIAADIHGKNHHVDGSFASHVSCLDLVRADGEVVTIGPDRDAEAFWATAGGMGLTGVIAQARIRLIPVETSRMLVDTVRAGDLDDVMARMEEGDRRHRYSVAWIDLAARGRQLGRSVITAGDHAPLDALSGAARHVPLAFDPQVRLAAPGLLPNGILNRLSVRAFNELWFRKAPAERRGEVQHLASFFHPLDGVRHWNRLYGPGGFVQYQFVVPFGAEHAVRAVIEQLGQAGAASFLAVLKRFGAGDPGPLSFPMPGWTLALDLPARGELAGLLDRLDRLVLDAGGRLYLAKDSRLDPADLPRMYPALDGWRATQARLDPEGLMRSDLGRRLGLLGSGAMTS